MMKNVVSKFIPEQNLLIKYYSGDIEISDIIQSKISEMNHEYFSSELCLIADYRDANVLINKDDLIALIDYAKENRSFLNHKKTALIADKPLQVAYSKLFQDLSKETPTQTEVFSTVEAALNWVRIEGQVQNEIIKDLMNLKYK